MSRVEGLMGGAHRNKKIFTPRKTFTGVAIFLCAFGVSVATFTHVFITSVPIKDSFAEEKDPMNYIDGAAIAGYIGDNVEPVFHGITTMQEMTMTICDSETTPNSLAIEKTTVHTNDSNFVPTASLIDTRDGKAYTVRKLADGNCWMTEDLKLGGNEPMILTSEDSDVATTFELPAVQYNLGTRWAANIADTESINTAHVAQAHNNYYYNWSAVTAKSGTYSMESTPALDSICPKGWQIPTGNGSTSYMNLLSNAYSFKNSESSISALKDLPFNFTTNGYYSFSTGGVDSYEKYGFIWTAMPHANRTNAYTMQIASSSFNTQSNVHKANGLAVRCVLRNAAKPEPVIPEPMPEPDPEASPESEEGAVESNQDIVW